MGAAEGHHLGRPARSFLFNAAASSRAFCREGDSGGADARRSAACWARSRSVADRESSDGTGGRGGTVAARSVSQLMTAPGSGAVPCAVGDGRGQGRLGPACPGESVGPWPDRRVRQLQAKPVGEVLPDDPSQPAGRVRRVRRRWTRPRTVRFARPRQGSRLVSVVRGVFSKFITLLFVTSSEQHVSKVDGSGVMDLASELPQERW